MSQVPANPKEYAKAVKLVKGRVARWPSAYASGQVVIEYKRAMAALGKPPYHIQAKKQPIAPLARWFAERWTDIRTGKPCGNAHDDNKYPTCRPAVKVSAATPVTLGELSKSQKTRMIAQKQQAGPATVHYRETKALRLHKHPQK